MKIRLIIIIICITLMLTVVSIIESFNHNRTEDPKQADVIIMLGGGDAGRMQKAAELYHTGYSDYVIISPAMDEHYAQSKQFALDLGIPEEAIIEEVAATAHTPMPQKHWQSWKTGVFKVHWSRRVTTI